MAFKIVLHHPVSRKWKVGDFSPENLGQLDFVVDYFNNDERYKAEWVGNSNQFLVPVYNWTCRISWNFFIVYFSYYDNCSCDCTNHRFYHSVETRLHTHAE